MSTLQLALAALLALFALAMWWGFIRTVPETTATGVIEAKVYKPEGTYERVPVELDRGFRVPTRIPTAEGYIFQVRLDGSGEITGVALNTILSRQFDEGDRVVVRFQRRGFPPLWERLTVTGMDPPEP